MKQTGGLKRSTTDTINSYITDMLALEEHIEKAVSGQIQALGDHPQVGADLRTIRHWVHIHIANLEQLTRTRGAATASGALKRAGSSVLGRAPSTSSVKKDSPGTFVTITPRSVWRPSAI